MRKQLFYEDVKEGSEITLLIRNTTVEQSGVWAGANKDYDPIHYNKEFALSQRLPDIIVNGRYKMALLIQYVTNWMGEDGVLKKIGCQHRGMDIIGDPLTCKGRVVKKYVSDGQHYVECEIWTENPKGEKTAPGSATVTLPSKKSS